MKRVNITSVPAWSVDDILWDVERIYTRNSNAFSLDVARLKIENEVIDYLIKVPGLINASVDCNQHHMNAVVLEMEFRIKHRGRWTCSYTHAPGQWIVVKNP